MKTISTVFLTALLVALPSSCKSAHHDTEAPCRCGTPEADVEGCANPCRDGKTNPEGMDCQNPDCLCGTLAIPPQK